MEKDTYSESVVKIDENNLDKECIRLPGDYLKYAHAAAEAKRDQAEAESQLKVVEADLGKAIRQDPAAYKMEKVTESAVSAVIVTQKDYRKALVAVQEAHYNAELAQAVVWALECKKRTLTLLVDLHGMGYFSTPKVSEKGRAAVEQMIQRRVRQPDRD